MCGILGIQDEKINLAEAFNLIQNRGKDAQKIVKKTNFQLAHCLHSIVGEKVIQPFEGKGIFAANCEIYNWEELAGKYGSKPRNDAELLFFLLENVFDEAEKSVNKTENKDLVSNEQNKKTKKNEKAKNDKEKDKKIKNEEENNKREVTEKIKKILNELDGDFAFVYKRNDIVILARDVIGVKPLWYSLNPFAFSSERKALEKLGCKNIDELNPRKILFYNLKTKEIMFEEQNFFDTKPEIKDSKEKIKVKIAGLLKESIKKRVPNRKIGVLFSGGIDSLILAKVLQDMKVDFTCYTAAIADPTLTDAPDLISAQKVSAHFGFSLKVKKIKLEEVENYLKIIAPLIEDSNVIKVGVGLTFYLACEEAKKDGVKVMLSGIGGEELFAGYERHQNSLDVNAECLAGLLKIYERDLYRDDVITMHHGIELRVPFLDHDLISYALKIPAEYKINCEKEGNEKEEDYNKEKIEKKNKTNVKKETKENKKDEEDGKVESDNKKIILRETAQDVLNIPKEFAWRKKQAAQYGSKTDRAIEKLAKRRKFPTKSEYLKQFYNPPNMRLGVLFSSGKDSTYALWIMKQQNYEISCLITLKSKNLHSYMFHTPAIDLAALQAQAMNIPIIEQETMGEKEKELVDLKTVIQKAKERYHIEGIVTGALYSNYQRERIEKIAEGLGLKVFCPLWRKDQELEMIELLKNNFKFVLSSVAAEGLDKTWLGRIITENDIDALVKLHKKYSINVAGEGGEFESLVLDCPLFKKKVNIDEFEIKEEGKNTA